MIIAVLNTILVHCINFNNITEYLINFLYNKIVVPTEEGKKYIFSHCISALNVYFHSFRK